MVLITLQNYVKFILTLYILRILQFTKKEQNHILFLNRYRLYNSLNGDSYSIKIQQIKRQNLHTKTYFVEAN